RPRCRRDARLHGGRRRLRRCRHAPQGEGRQGRPHRLRRRPLPARLRDAARARPRLTAVPTERRTAFGQPLRRLEDEPLMRGAAEFVDDVHRPELLHAVFVRSPVAHARLRRVELAGARTVRGVAAVFGAADVALPPLVSACETPQAYAPPRPLLADEVVRFVGEPVAVVVGESRYAAEDGAEAVELELDPLEPLVDPLRALAPGAPLVHDGTPN